MSHHNKPFYGKWIVPDDEEKHIKELIHPYQDQPVTDELRKQIYELLSDAKFRGEISIPFRIVLHQDAYKKYPDRLEVILDTKV